MCHLLLCSFSIMINLLSIHIQWSRPRKQQDIVIWNSIRFMLSVLVPWPFSSCMKVIELVYAQYNLWKCNLWWVSIAHTWKINLIYKLDNFTESFSIYLLSKLCVSWRPNPIPPIWSAHQSVSRWTNCFTITCGTKIFNLSLNHKNLTEYLENVLPSPPIFQEKLKLT